MDDSLFSDFVSMPVASSSRLSQDPMLIENQQTKSKQQQSQHSSSAITQSSRSKQSSNKQMKRTRGKGRMMLVKVFYSLQNKVTAVSNASESGTPSQNDFLSPAENGTFGASPRLDGHTVHRYNCLARTSQPVWVNLVGQDAESERPRFGRLTLKTCLSAICISRPELVSDPSKDYTISAVDPYEFALMNPERTSFAAGEGIMEGKGMLSWGLAEKREGTTWICGRVVPNDRRERPTKRQKMSNDKDLDNYTDDEDDEDACDTLELYLQLTERPSFTHDQFLRSMRSFANPPSVASATSDRVSPPRSGSFGDPVKRKRPRMSQQPLPTPPSSAFLPVPSSDAPQRDNAALLGALQELLPSLHSQASEPVDTTTLLPALRTLAGQYGVSDLQVDEEGANAANASTASASRSTSANSKPAFVVISSSGKGNPSQPSPVDPEEGCGNCRRRKSATWREGPNGAGGLMRVCNACGTFYNRHGHHRDHVAGGAARVSSPTRSTHSATSNRALKPRLSAVCESDLAKQKRTNSTAGIVPPPSPSKHIGPKSPVFYQYHRTHHKSPKHPQHRMIGSPLKSPNLLSRNPFVGGLSPSRPPRLSPIFGGASGGAGSAGRSLDYLFGAAPRSPSPVKTSSASRTSRNDYLLTASPGTALDRLLSETSVDFGSFGQDTFDFDAAMPDASATKQGDARHLQAGSNEFDSVLSSLRKDFHNRLSSAAEEGAGNDSTLAPSPPSSPCVLPRTSSATPGQKGKAPASCGRPAPSVHTSYIDSLVPALALNEKDSMHQQRRRMTPDVSSDENDEDETMTFDTNQQHSSKRQRSRAKGPVGKIDFALPPKAKRWILSAQTMGSTTSEADFDSGSLPPSSPPALPSDAGGGPTPSDLSGYTPEEYPLVGKSSATLNGNSGSLDFRRSPEQANEVTMPDGRKVRLDNASMDQLLSIFSSSVDAS